MQFGIRSLGGIGVHRERWLDSVGRKLRDTPCNMLSEMWTSSPWSGDREWKLTTGREGRISEFIKSDARSFHLPGMCLRAS